MKKTVTTYYRAVFDKYGHIIDDFSGMEWGSSYPFTSKEHILSYLNGEDCEKYHNDASGFYCPDPEENGNYHIESMTVTSYVESTGWTKE